MLSCDRSSENENITTIVNISDFKSKHSQLVFSATVSTCWITPDEGISSVIVQNPQTKYYTSSIIRRTFDGGKNWNLCKKFRHIVKSIQYVDGVLYAYLNNESRSFELGVNDPSWIIASSDLGKTWSTLYKFEYNISNLMVIDSTTMVAISEISTTEEQVDTSHSNNRIIISRDGGRSWNKIDGLPRIKTSPMPIYRVGTKLYFKVATPDEYKYLHSFDFDTGKYNRQKIIGRFGTLHSYAVVDDLLIRPSNGICTYKMTSDSLQYISDYTWGWRAGAYNVAYAAKDDNYIFVYSGRFPGNHDIDDALHFSSDNGKNWNALAFAPKEITLPWAMSWSSYTDDSIFQVSAINGDITRIYRVNKKNK